MGDISERQEWDEMVKLIWEYFEQVLMEEQDERKEEVLVVIDSVLEEEEEWGQHGAVQQTPEDPSYR